MAGPSAEVWKPAPGHPGYEVSSLGRVRSLDRVITRRCSYGEVTARLYGKLLKPYISRSTGYAVVGLKCRPVLVHALVCEAFHGPRPAGYQCAHNDGTRDNNRADNLRWATASENNRDKQVHGTQQDQRGERGPGAKLTTEQARQVKALGGTMTQAQIGKLFGIHQTTVHDIIVGKRWAVLNEGAAA